MKEQIIHYLRDNVIGRPLKTDDTIYNLEDGKMEGIYSDQMTFSDLCITENGIQFNMTTVSNEKIYTLGDDKKRMKIMKDYTGTSVFRYEIAIRKSTGKVTGYMRCLSSSVVDQTMEAIVYGVCDVIFENNQLKWKEQQLFYRDLLAEKGKYCPVAFDSDARFYKEGDKLKFEYTPKLFDVNPINMVKTLAKNQYPSYVSKEV